MKALPKHCLPHHAVLLLVYLSALFLTSRAANLPNLFYMAFNGLAAGAERRLSAPGVPDLAGKVSRRKLLREYYKKAQKELVKPFFFSMN